MNELLSALEVSVDPLETRDLIVMILVQKVLGFTVCGRPLQKELIQLLISSNKLPEDLCGKLKTIETEPLQLKSLLSLGMTKGRR